MKQVDRSSILFAIIIIVSLAIRIWGINYDLPYIYHPDEPHSLTVSQNIFKTGDLNPHFFEYPSVFFYINALAYIPYYLFGKLQGVFTARSDILAPLSLVMGVTKSQMPTTVLLGRIITVIFGAGTLGTTFVIGKRLAGKASVGLLASLMLAISLPNVSLSRFISPDTFMVFFATAAFLASLLIYQQGKTRYYILAGIFVGLTASTKYNGGIIVLPMIFAHFLRFGRESLRNRNLYIALLMCGLGFLAGTPYALIDFPKFWGDMRFQSLHYSAGHAGMEGNTLRWYLNYMWSTGSIIYILSLLGIFQGIYSRSKEIFLLSVLPVAYFVFINIFMVRNDRTFLLMTPFLFLLAATLLEFLIRISSEVESKIWHYASRFVTGCLLITIIVMPAFVTVKNTIGLTSVDGRETSRIWIADNLPAGAKIAIESYSPFVDPARFSVQGVVRIINHDPDWYVKNGYEYLVFSEGMFGRFYNEPDVYRSEVLLYDEFFNRFRLVKIFNDGNYEIRVYKVSSTPY
jgi:4-amino-4-deoxy-L-arabinose transferase-like glycosyltransferase